MHVILLILLSFFKIFIFLVFSSYTYNCTNYSNKFICFFNTFLFWSWHFERYFRIH